jgi:hypothetical protein
MRRFLPLLSLGLVCVTVVSAAADGPKPPAGEAGYDTGSRSVSFGGGHSSEVSATSTRSGNFGHGASGRENVRFDAEGRGSGRSGPVITGPAACGEGPLIIPPTAEDAPAFSIQTNPRGSGVVSIDTRFSLIGQFDGHVVTRRVLATFARTTPSFDPTTGAFVDCVPLDRGEVWVRVLYWPVRYQWDYGDGTLAQISCGTTPAVPAPCEFGVNQEDEVLIHHTYEVSSARHFDQQGYQVVATVVFAMGISPDTDDLSQVTVLLPEVPDRAWLRFQVREVQSVLVD